MELKRIDLIAGAREAGAVEEGGDPADVGRQGDGADCGGVGEVAGGRRLVGSTPHRGPIAAVAPRLRAMLRQASGYIPWQSVSPPSDLPASERHEHRQVCRRPRSTDRETIHPQ